MEYTIRIGGEAGQGLQYTGAFLAKHLSRSGFFVFSHQDYMSRIRGGHNFYQIRVSEDGPVCASRDKVDILLALDQLTVGIHLDTLCGGGIVLYDARMIGREFSGPQFSNIPFTGIIEELKLNKIMVNSVAVGAVLNLLGIEPHGLTDTLRFFMKKKGEDVINSNLSAIQAGFDYLQKEPKAGSLSLQRPTEKKLMLINGNQAIGLGAVAGGCKFYSAYPMTPSTSIMITLAGKAREHNIVVEQAEDEISAINMALGASFGGVRAMTGTSGGGFALMTEGLSLAAITETPIVIAEVQRPGPATGLPTRTEQGDLLFVLYGGHGEFPRVVFAPGTPEQAYHLTQKAFSLAEKYQIPAIILSDQYLADSEWTFPEIAPGPVPYEDFRLRREALEQMATYSRYFLTENGISKLAVPGESVHLVVADSDEHDEEGHMIEDAETRIKMVEKRLHKKMALLKNEISPPSYYGDPQAQIILAGFGSTYGLLKEAVDILASHHPIGMLHFSEVYPLPLPEKFNYIELLGKARFTVCIENNATGQLARYIRSETGLNFHARINKYDGRPFGLDSLLGEINDHLRRL